MHILLTNDDGPPDDNTSPYIKYFLDEVQRSTDWKVTIVIPNQQRSWIGKAHFAGRVLEVSYIYTLPSTESHNEGINSFEGPFAERHQSLRQTHQEWHLVNSTPAACADLGLHHLTSHDEPIDLVISGPNYGKNSGNLYILGSGTVGAAMEAVTHGAKAIALSYEFRSQAKDHNQLKEAAKLSLKIARKLHENLTKNFEVDLYSVNIPLVPSLDTNNTSVMYAPIQNNSWKSIYASLGNGRFGWAPDFKQVYKDGLVDAKHSDNRVLLNDNVSAYSIEVDYAEFLDDALDEAFELRQELETSKKTWILKPSMADKGQGIRLFRNTEELQAIFESFEEDVHESDDEGEQEGIMVSQLRHFVVQKYQENPLLLKFYNNRKFHLRVYAVAVGDISVFVYEEMLTLFAESTYMGVSDLEDLTSHLTNTCLQEGKDPLVIPFWQLAGLDSSKKNQIFDQVKCITGELFKAATSVDKINFQPLENALEFYGLDFLVDEDHSVKLLEVNAYPDFKQTGYELKGIIEKLMTSMAHLSAKQFFAEPLQDESNVLHLVFRNDFHPPKHAK
ncbi:5'/3'-nucleotidase SurE [Candidozyma duobushaemuli]|uniref:5'/3'-nucleotidase SurE n=1 Tax=Candidozyma duobushaemuli TaxID=1231522 RepID=A0A2V1ADH2_9ASCO|nr:5'/3'-nucleotidase SurE [[Candida] duobushaemulonis]PVH16130.1 5'/3'-nucleotidase SurE [[Candida] duobushaemulonis]